MTSASPDAVAPSEPTLAPAAPVEPLPIERMLGRPFGVDAEGRRIAHGSGRTVVAAIRYLQGVVGERAAREAPAGLDPVALEARVERARTEALDRLVTMLNEAIADERYHVTAEYLLNEGNHYSYEFRLFVVEFARRICGADRDFFFDMGLRTIPHAIVDLVRPLGVRGTFAILPRLTARYVRTDLRVERSSRSGATILWYGADQLAEIPEPHRRSYLEFACRTYQGTFAAIPTAGWGLPPATVRQVRCQLEGADHCEWALEWTPPPRRADLRSLVLGGAGSATMLAYLLLGLPYAEGLAIVAAALLPAAVVLYGGGARRMAGQLRERQALLVEQRETSEREYERSERANAETQIANLDLQSRVSELMALNELGVALSTTLDLDELLDRALHSVVTHLHFDRALVLLADDARGVLSGGRSVGGTDEMSGLVRGLELPLDRPGSQLVALYRASGPVLFTDVDRDPFEPNRAFAEALGVTSFLGTPLISKGRTVGILAVDNRLTGREMEPDDGPLLFTLGNLIASAIENASLYRQIEEQNRALEERVARRTAQLAAATEEAQAARAVAEAASEAKSAFLANVSHELRTPLTSVVGFTRIVQRRLRDVVFPVMTSDDPKVGRAVRQVDENLAIMAAEGERLTAMINDVLDLAKIEAGRFDWAMRSLAIEDVVARATAATAALFESTGLELETALEADLPPLVGDRDRLIQVVINLISNAVKFTPSGRVTVRAIAVDGGVTVAVADTGVGIAPADQETVWESFRQAGDTLTDKPRGTGLGLPICRQIVEHHGGRMWLDSAIGEGSTFSLWLPLDGGAPAATEPAAASNV